MEIEVQQTKAAYNEALQNLEKISDEIHKLREDQKLNEFHEEVCNDWGEAFRVKDWDEVCLLAEALRKYVFTEIQEESAIKENSDSDLCILSHLTFKVIRRNVFKNSAASFGESF